MTLKSDKNAKPSSLAAANPKPEAPTPKLFLPVGRGSRGKTFLARWLIDRAQTQGREIVVADADRTNPSLAGYLNGVLTPPSADENEMGEWFKALCEQPDRSALQPSDRSRRRRPAAQTAGAPRRSGAVP